MKDYGKYSSIAIELLLIVFAAVFVGVKFDVSFVELKPLFTVLMSLSGVALGLFVTLKRLIKK